MCLSLTKADYVAKLSSLKEENNVAMLNPLSSDLNVLRQTTLFSGLETIAYNQNRKNADVKVYEFGRTYMTFKKDEESKYSETKHMSVFLSGKKQKASWNSTTGSVNFYTLKGVVLAVLSRLGLNKIKLQEINNELFTDGLSYSFKKKTLVEFGSVSQSILKSMGIKQAVFYADFNWDTVISCINTNNVQYTEVSKFPEVKRDLALLIEKDVNFNELENLALQTEKSFLKSVSLFDVYTGDKLPEGKKSYALNFVLQDDTATLTDKRIDKIMDKLMRTYKEKVSAEIR
jgi:phenylalanyl-tRNA synthetase beta chain